MHTELAKIGKLSVCIMPERDSSNEPSASAFVRLILPYAKNPTLIQNWDITVFEKRKLPNPSTADIFIIERDVAGIDLGKIANWLIKIREAKKKCILEIDDDFFDEEGLCERTGKNRNYIKRTIDRAIWISSAVDAITVSTPQLYKLASKYNKNVFLLPNYLDPELWGISKSRRSPGRKKDIVKIGYVGTSTHNEDLMIVADVMNKIEHEYGNKIKIEVIGAFQENLKSPMFGEAIPLPKERSYPKFVQWLKKHADWDIAIIPLVDDRFNESKSHLKFLELTALGIVAICSNVPTYYSIVENNRNGLLVIDNFEDWYKAVKLLIDDLEKRKMLSQAAYLDLFEKYTTYTNSASYNQMLLDVTSLKTSPKIPLIKRNVKENLIHYVAKYGSQNSRLCVKLLYDPYYYFFDSKHAFLRPLRIFFKNR